ncbi:hypothetical protein METP1_01215 [Methanosarcinales archaeon]|nr:hypothetical protein METP1_01215 [Methanosarcinales archaeon]
MCRQCLPITKNKEQQMNDSKDSKNKNIVIEEHEPILKKT